LNLYVEEVMNYQVGSKAVVAESSPAALLG
jgi:hypothetical protein